MKKISSVIFLSFLVLLLLVTPVISSDDWVEYRTDKDGNVDSYKKGNVEKKDGEYIVQIWEKRFYSDEGRVKEFQRMMGSGVSTKKYDKLSHRIYLIEINCKKKMSQTLYVVVYDTDGKGLHSENFDKGKGEYIVPDSVDDNLRKQVCQ